MDIDSIPLGVNFREYIAEALQDTDLVLAIIGPRWRGDDERKARIDHPSDPVRIEVEKAFELKIPVWPVLVDNADMPERTSLPESIQALSDHNAAFVASGRDFHPHMDRLVRQIDRFLGTMPDARQESNSSSVTKTKPHPRRSAVVFAGLVAATAVAAIGLFFWLGRSEPSAVVPVTPSMEGTGAVPCKEERTLRSLSTTTPTSILFVNKSNRAKRVYWLNDEGKRELYFNLEAGQSIRQPTFISHPWVIADTSDRCEAIHMPTPATQEVLIVN